MADRSRHPIIAIVADITAGIPTATASRESAVA